jgi:hypothetical protein
MAVSAGGEMRVDEVEVEVWRLLQDKYFKDVVVLRDERRRHLPIWIGPCEAAAIWVKLDPRNAGAILRRPMTHDLCAAIIERLGGRIERIVIDDYSNETYYAKIHVAVNGRALAIDARPSDAIALALRAGASVWVRDEIMEAGNVALEQDDGAPPASAQDEPEDFEEEEPDSD